MKMKIAILGSTGSIGKSTLDVIRKDKKKFEVVFLSAKAGYIVTPLYTTYNGWLFAISGANLAIRIR